MADTDPMATKIEAAATDIVELRVADIDKAETAANDAQEFITVQDIRIYTGLTTKTRIAMQQNIDRYRAAIAERAIMCPEIPRLSELCSSTITAQGCISNIAFNEEELIKRIPAPTGNILFIGCNFGELVNEEFKASVMGKVMATARRPKPKLKPKRIMKGSGKYFGSQMTFDIRNAENQHTYKIKLFRTGVFQVPHVRSPDMHDLCGPITTLLEYLRPIFGADITVTDFKAVMRNYKSELRSPQLFVDLQQMNRVLHELKDLDGFPMLELQGLRLGIAEITYNVDRHASLLVKFNRPTAQDSTKQTTIKLIKSGKINFDGGSNRMEIEELYLIISAIYAWYAPRVVVDRTVIMDKLADNERSIVIQESCGAQNVQNIDSQDNSDNISLYDYHLELSANPQILIDNPDVTVDPRAMAAALEITRGVQAVQYVDA